jgi:endonuclease/exonuclease/phosphatase family metal-dependent hydrolase
MCCRNKSAWGLMLIVACIVFNSPMAVAVAEETTLRVMTFNVWVDGTAGKQTLEQSAAVIRAAKADVVGLQESGPSAAKLATLLGWHYVDQGGRTAILSRHKIVGTTPRKWGAKIELPDGRHVYHFNAHFMYIPYQPYQLLDIPYGKHPFLKTEAEAIEAAQKTRGGQVAAMLAEVAAVRGEKLAMFVSGDFNEPSHLDWTAAARDAKLCPIAVAWPTTKTVVEAGFIDGYRAVHPDPVKHRGITWTPTTKVTDPKDRHDRIDFVFGERAKAVAAEVVGEHADNADIVVDPYPSDHRAVVVEFQLAP